MHIPEQLISYAALYLKIGACVALGFVSWGIARSEPSAKGGSWGFRALMLPGATLLWPLVAVRWFRALKRTS
jgi:hypothetical protein